MRSGKEAETLQHQLIATLEAQQGIDLGVRLLRSKAELTRTRGRMDEMEASGVKILVISKENDSCTTSCHLRSVAEHSAGLATVS
jgi:hypothetical protein